ncbi:MAG TPA: hypothetical protein VG347_02295 [Verrucomicrobiae bacterium]|nr:hypothetical protein [Verrucomicrobiae bacterium]
MTKASRTSLALWCRRLIPAILVMAVGLDCLAQTSNVTLAGANTGSVIEARLAVFRDMLPQFAGSQQDPVENRLTLATADKPVDDIYGGTMHCNIIAFVYSNNILPRTICLHLTSQAKSERFRSLHDVNIRRDDVFFSPNVLTYDNKQVAGAGIVEQVFPELTPDQLHDVAFSRAMFFQVGTNAYEVSYFQRQSWRLLWTYFALNRAKVNAQAGQSSPLPPVMKEETDFQIAAKAREKQRTIVLSKALQANQEAAAQGDAYGLLRMGERYRDGEGVEQDLVKARDYLKKAADAGSPTAADELAALPGPSK